MEKFVNFFEAEKLVSNTRFQIDNDKLIIN